MVSTMQIADLGAIWVFAKVVELRSFRAAAQALGAPPSTVSHKVAQLEDRLGVRLIERTTRALRLTEAGAAYHRQVVPALEALTDAERSLFDTQAAPRGTLRISAPSEFAHLALGSVVAETMRRHPSLKMQVELTDRVVDLVEEGFDAALRRGPLQDSTLFSRKIGPSWRLGLYASRDYLQRRGEPRKPEDLLEHDCLVMTGLHNPARWTFRRGRKRITVDVRARAKANSFQLLSELAVAGQGIARVPELVGERAAPRGALRSVLDEYGDEPFEFHLVYPSARHASPKLRALLETFEDAHAGRNEG
ncbi:MAG: LysR family transcriptional regulator [Polyangiaceae bacterium]|nr:LysR family transcriptional regulator [Polyangiaceae bacterium]